MVTVLNITSRFRKVAASLTDDKNLLSYLYISLFLLWIIFELVKEIWADDPFQKVVLAPLSEEPFKLLLGLVLCIAYALGGIVSIVFKRKNRHIETGNESYKDMR
ncbi:MAG: hypothetical protein QXS02_04420, partial [Candidatus Thermoplasmatota archaeon]